MRKTVVAVIVITMAAWGSGASIADVPTACGTLFITYPRDVGFTTPEAAAHDAVAEFDSDVDLPADIDEGETDLGGYDTLVVEQTDAGFVTHAIRECDVEPMLAFGDPALAHSPDVYVNPSRAIRPTTGVGRTPTWPTISPRRSRPHMLARSSAASRHGTRWPWTSR